MREGIHILRVCHACCDIVKDSLQAGLAQASPRVWYRVWIYPVDVPSEKVERIEESLSGVIGYFQSSAAV